MAVFRHARTVRILVSLALSCLLAVGAEPVLAAAAADGAGTPSPSLASEFADIAELRSQGRYQDAIALCDDLIARHTDSDAVLRLAYDHLVFTLLVAKEQEEMEAKSREALRRFPDLRAPEADFPPALNAAYDRLRGEMFGSLQITTEPDSSSVFLGREFEGFTPLNIRYLPAGTYPLTIAKTGYRDHADTLIVVPSQRLTKDIDMVRLRSTWWWGKRILVGALGVSAVLLLTSSDDRNSLPGPPAPPSR